jgi:hypothetical protein
MKCLNLYTCFFCEKQDFVAAPAPSSLDGERLVFIFSAIDCHHPAQNAHPLLQYATLRRKHALKTK